MKNTIRCCISCILPCGVLDVIRIVHANGRVQEISGTIRAADVMKAYPKHVLKKPSSTSGEGCCPKIVIVPPDAELQRGKIYFVMPVPEKTRSSRSSRRKRSREAQNSNPNSTNTTRSNRTNSNQSIIPVSTTNNDLLLSDQNLREILSENMWTQPNRRRGRAGVWRPHLESISETPTDV